MFPTDYRKAGKHLRGADLASDDQVIFEIKKVSGMPIGRLQQFHGAMIEVELEIVGRLRSVTGRGVYDACDADFGPVLRVVVSDPSGNFEVFLAESKWGGCFEPSALPGCDYRISFRSCPAC